MRKVSFQASYDADDVRLYTGETVTWTLTVHNPTSSQQLIDYEIAHPRQLGARTTVDAAGTYGYSGDGSHDAGADRITLPANGTGYLTFQYTFSETDDNLPLTSAIKLTEVLGTTIDSEGNTITQSDPFTWRSAPAVYLNRWGGGPTSEAVDPRQGFQHWIFGQDESAARVRDAIAQGRTFIDVLEEVGSAASGVDAETLDGIDSTSFWRNDTSASHPSTVAIATSASAAGTNAVAIGVSSSAAGYAGVAAGNLADATGNQGVALGYNTSADGVDSVAIGRDALAAGISAVAVGEDTVAQGDTTVAIGEQASANATSGNGAIAVGYQATANTTLGAAFGYQAVAGDRGVAAGYSPDATGADSVAIGSDAQALVSNATSVGHDANVGASANNSAALGWGASAQGTNSLSILAGDANAAYSIAIGFASEANTTSGTGSVAIGYDATAAVNVGVAIGYLSDAVAASTAVGYLSQATGTNSTAFGQGTTASGFHGIAAGNSATASNSYALAIGSLATASAGDSVALGRNTTASASGAVALGNGVTAATADTTSVDNLEVQGATASVNGISLFGTATSQAGTTYTLALGDAGDTIYFTNAAQCTVTVPTNASVAFPVGTRIQLFADGAGGVTLTTTSLTLLGSSPNKTISQNEMLYLEKTATDTWIIAGGTAA